MLRLHKAILMAAAAHDGQDRGGRDSLPYITHPMDVLSKLYEIGGVRDEDILCAAALHDVIEHAGGTEQVIAEAFGPRVLQLVLMMTREEPSAAEIAGLGKAEVRDLRSKRLLDEIEHKMDIDCWQIKLADRLSNFENALTTREGEKLKRYFDQTDRILEIIPRSANPGLWDALHQAVAVAKRLRKK